MPIFIPNINLWNIFPDIKPRYAFGSLSKLFYYTITLNKKSNITIHYSNDYTIPITLHKTLNDACLNINPTDTTPTNHVGYIFASKTCGALFIPFDELTNIPFNEQPFKKINQPSLWNETRITYIYNQLEKPNNTERNQCSQVALSMLMRLATNQSNKYAYNTDWPKKYGDTFNHHTYIPDCAQLLHNQNTTLYTHITYKLNPNQILNTLNNGYAILVPIQNNTHVCILLKTTQDKYLMIDEYAITPLSLKQIHNLLKTNTPQKTGTIICGVLNHISIHTLL